MSAEQFQYRADLERFVRPISPAPPDVPTAAPPQRRAGPPAIVLPLRENEAAGSHGLAALGTGGDVGQYDVDSVVRHESGGLAHESERSDRSWWRRRRSRSTALGES